MSIPYFLNGSVKLNEKNKEEALDWASKNSTKPKVAKHLAELKEALRTGERAKTLTESRKISVILC